MTTFDYPISLSSFSWKFCCTIDEWFIDEYITLGPLTCYFKGILVELFLFDLELCFIDYFFLIVISAI